MQGHLITDLDIVSRKLIESLLLQTVRIPSGSGLCSRNRGTAQDGGASHALPHKPQPASTKRTWLRYQTSSPKSRRSQSTTAEAGAARTHQVWTAPLVLKGGGSSLETAAPKIERTRKRSLIHTPHRGISSNHHSTVHACFNWIRTSFDESRNCAGWKRLS